MSAVPTGPRREGAHVYDWVERVEGATDRYATGGH